MGGSCTYEQFMNGDTIDSTTETSTSNGNTGADETTDESGGDDVLAQLTNQLLTSVILNPESNADEEGSAGTDGEETSSSQMFPAEVQATFAALYLPLLNDNENVFLVQPDGTTSFDNTTTTESTVTGERTRPDETGELPLPSTTVTSIESTVQTYQAADDWTIVQSVTNDFDRDESAVTEVGDDENLGRNGGETYSVTITNGTKIVESWSTTSTSTSVMGAIPGQEDSDDPFAIPEDWITASRTSLNTSDDEESEDPTASEPVTEEVPAADDDDGTADADGSGTNFSTTNTVSTTNTQEIVTLDDGSQALQITVSMSFSIGFTWTAGGNFSSDGADVIAELPAQFSGLTIASTHQYQAYAGGSVGGGFTASTTVPMLAFGIPDLTNATYETSFDFGISANVGGSITRTVTANMDERSGSVTDDTDEELFVDIDDTDSTNSSASVSFSVSIGSDDNDDDSGAEFTLDISGSNVSTTNRTFREKVRSDTQDGVYSYSMSSENSSDSSDRSFNLALGTDADEFTYSTSHDSFSDTSSTDIETSQMYGDDDPTGVGTPYGATWFEFRGITTAEKSDSEESSSNFELTVGGTAGSSLTNTSSSSADGSSSWVDESTNHSVLLNGSEEIIVATDTTEYTYWVDIPEDGDPSGEGTLTHSLTYEGDPNLTDVIDPPITVSLTASDFPEEPDAEAVTINENQSVPLGSEWTWGAIFGYPSRAAVLDGIPFIPPSTLPTQPNDIPYYRQGGNSYWSGQLQGSQTVGPFGCGPCVGVTLVSQGSSDNTYSFHIGPYARTSIIPQALSANGDLFPQGREHGQIVGGDVSTLLARPRFAAYLNGGEGPEGAENLQRVIGSLNRLGINILGYVPRPAITIDADGNVSVVPSGTGNSGYYQP